MTELAFTKYQGLGNDFVVIDASDPEQMTPERAREICDRHFGIGADGVLLVLSGDKGAHARMKVLNADGSVPEMCGNGLRCVAEHVGRARNLPEVIVATDAGTFTCARTEGNVRVDMGIVAASVETRIEVAGRGYIVREVDMGNPHAVVFDAELARSDAAAKLGPKFQKHAQFPRGVNVEFVHDTHNAALNVVVWERGVGLTLACGTGACAVARAAVDTMRRSVNEDILVALPGGTLTMRVERDNRLIMTGPAQRVFAGQLAP